MQRKFIDSAHLIVQPHDLFHHQWALLTAGNFESGQFNTMTIGWGAIGTMWSKPFVYVAVRHSRYTYQFMEKFDTFTIAAFPSQYHEALTMLGTLSGRDSQKIADSGLTPEASLQIPAPSFKEAELVLECKKIYADDLNPAHFLDESIHKHYPNRDYHCIYYGEILVVTGVEKYAA
jgi:flavin reductase (DIM6/NTAB) family NADH-FMN oxidoreductase RutF